MPLLPTRQVLHGNVGIPMCRSCLFGTVSLLSALSAPTFYPIDILNYKWYLWPPPIWALYVLSPCLDIPSAWIKCTAATKWTLAHIWTKYSTIHLRFSPLQIIHTFTFNCTYFNPLHIAASPWWVLLPMLSKVPRVISRAGRVSGVKCADHVHSVMFTIEPSADDADCANGADCATAVMLLVQLLFRVPMMPMVSIVPIVPTAPLLSSYLLKSCSECRWCRQCRQVSWCRQCRRCRACVLCLNSSYKQTSGFNEW